MESCPWDYQTILSHEDKNIKASFCREPPPEVREEVFSSAVMSKDSDTVDEKGTSGEKPKKFGPHPDFNSLNYDFNKELARLPFPLNLGKVDLSKDQEVRFLELIYDNQSVFSLGDEDLGLCDRLKHTIPTTTAVFAAFGGFFLSLAVFRWSGQAWCTRIGSWRSLDVLGHV